jgi:hypothetical protein
VDLTPYVESLRHELAVAAEAGGAEARALAERLAAPLESATRLVLLEALSAAADEITRDLAPGSVEVRLRGRDHELVVTPPPLDAPAGEEAEGLGLGPALARAVEVAMGVRPPVSSEAPDADEGGTARISLRLPDHLKPRVDEAAGRAGLSVNAWLVRVVAASVDVDERARNPGARRSSQFGGRYSGWVR